MIRADIPLYRFRASTQEGRIRQSSPCVNCCRGDSQVIVEDTPYDNTPHMTDIVVSFAIRVDERKRYKWDGYEARHAVSAVNTS